VGVNQVSHTSGRFALMESRLGSDAIRAWERTIRLRGVASSVAFLGGLVTMGFAAYASSPVATGQAFVTFLATAVLLRSAVVSQRRAVQILLDRYDLPSACGSRVIGRTWRDPVAFDKWLAESRMAVSNARTR
jgi:hypothetical protein